MQLLVGGSGFLGATLARRLIERGEPVRVFDRARSSRLPEGAEFRQGDVRDRAALAATARGCEIVFHLVGIMPQARMPEPEMRAINVGGLENTLAAAAGARVKRVVFLSSSEVYGRPMFSPMTEDHPLAPMGEYGRNKVSGEELCRRYRREEGLSVVMLRPTTIVGPEMTEPTFLRGMAAAHWAPFFSIGSGEHRFQMVYVGDVAEACILASRREGVDGEAFNLGSERTLCFRDQLRALAEHLGRRPKIYSLPVGLFKGIMRTFHLLGIAPMEPDHYELADADFVLDIAKARDRLGFRPSKTNLEMIYETYEWYRGTH